VNEQWRECIGGKASASYWWLGVNYSFALASALIDAAAAVASSVPRALMWHSR
jgi:hypothetical protein